jgi:hypothetical protein
MSLIIRLREGWFLGLFLGVVLIACFLVLFSLVLALFASWLGASLHTRARQWMAGLGAAGLVGVVLVVGAAVDWDVPTLAHTILDHPLWQTLTWPLASFFHLMTAQTWGVLLGSLAVALGVNGLLVLLIFGLDAQFLEQSAAGSAAIYAKILRARGQTVAVEPLAGREQRRGWSLPMLPYLGGLGPIVWRQLLTGFRSTGRLALVFFVLGATLTGPIAVQFGKTNLLLLIGSLVMLFLWLSILLPVIVPFDFRGDIDRMATLKTFPLAPWRLALGQMLVPALLLSVAKAIILLGVALVFPAFLPYLGMGLVIVPVFNLYVIGVENLLFLLFPTRIGAVTPGDFQAMGRNILLSFGKGVGLFVPMLAGGIGFGVGYLTEWIWLGVLVGITIVLIACAGLVVLAGWAFEAFDVGRNTPA